MDGTKQAAKALYEIAADQEGYFTTKQAIAAGFADSTHNYHLKNGDWLKAWRGIYRLTDFPYLTNRPELMLWQLWSRGRDEKPQSTFSYETALDFYELSDNMPDKLHITVPKSFRRSQEIPDILNLHYEDLKETDILHKQKIRITTPVKTLVDIVAEEKLPRSMIIDAINQSIKKGLALRADFENAEISGPEWAKEQVQKLASKYGGL